eukprot:GILJ01006446.1.p1 GENE.GILJ01006446.1~~GILJ01006446.1.p1  ORF type:complete len:423 (-),score=36.81 GILJ01006446.1:169-1437(-)
MEGVLNILNSKRPPASFLQCLLAVEVLVCVALIFTDDLYIFDWDAYMEQVASVFQDGQLDYTQIKGDTGPLVYPAGHVWLFGMLYYITGWDHHTFTTIDVTHRDAIPGYEHRNVLPLGRLRLIQCLYLCLYIFLLSLLLHLYRRGRTIPVKAYFLLSLSRRVHSIFVLGFFNDCFAMSFLYLSIYFMLQDSWMVGCVWFSMAVSIKMNVLLFAPGLLLLLLQRYPPRQVVLCLAICASIQLALASPFLLVNPLGYLSKAFDLGRVFLLEWSVNWKFLPESLFQSKAFASLLLFSHILVVCCFAKARWWRKDRFAEAGNQTMRTRNLSAEHILSVLFESNFIGIVFARSLHYQFLVWYFHTLPFLLWSVDIRGVYRLLWIVVVEVVWNVHHSTAWSALCLQAAHAILLYCLWTRRKPTGSHLE